MSGKKDKPMSGIRYTIPEEICSRIPDYFYAAFAGELFSVFGWEQAKWMFYPEDRRDYTDLDSSSAGWVEAFKATCRKLDMSWLIDYYNTLPWYDSDVFDGIIEAEIGKRFMKGSGEQSNAYYRFLTEQSMAEEAAKEEKQSAEQKKDGGNSLAALASVFNGLYDEAYRTYLPQVQQICGVTGSKDDLEHLLSWMLDFVADERMEALYDKVCDKYSALYPETIQVYKEYKAEVLNPEIPDELTEEDDTGGGEPDVESREGGCVPAGLQPAVRKLLDAARNAAEGKGEYSTYADVFGEEDEEDQET